MSKQVLDNGEYILSIGQSFLNSWPTGTWTPPFIDPIMPGGFAGPHSTWRIEHVKEGAYRMTNISTGFKAWVHKEAKDVRVYNNSDDETHFAIERAGNNEYVIKAVNANLDWTMVDIGAPGNPFLQIFLRDSDGSSSQHFRFEFIRGINGN